MGKEMVTSTFYPTPSLPCLAYPSACSLLPLDLVSVVGRRLGTLAGDSLSGLLGRKRLVGFGLFSLGFELGAFGNAAQGRELGESLFAKGSFVGRAVRDFDSAGFKIGRGLLDE